MGIRWIPQGIPWGTPWGTPRGSRPSAPCLFGVRLARGFEFDHLHHLIAGARSVGEIPKTVKNVNQTDNKGEEDNIKGNKNLNQTMIGTHLQPSLQPLSPLQPFCNPF